MFYKKLMISLFIFLFVQNNVYSMEDTSSETDISTITNLLSKEDIDAIIKLYANDTPQEVNEYEKNLETQTITQDPQGQTMHDDQESFLQELFGDNDLEHNEYEVNRIMQGLQEHLSQSGEKEITDSSMKDATLSQNNSSPKRKNICKDAVQEKKRKLMCTIEGCDFITGGKKRAIKLHKNWHEGGEYRCNACRLAYYNIISLHVHKLKKHVADLSQKKIDSYNQERALYCKPKNGEEKCKEAGCTIISKRKSRLDAHKMWHARKGYPCTVCPHAYPTPGALSNHKKAH